MCTTQPDASRDGDGAVPARVPSRDAWAAVGHGGERGALPHAVPGPGGGSPLPHAWAHGRGLVKRLCSSLALSIKH